MLTLEEKPGFLFELRQVLEAVSNVESWPALKAACGGGFSHFLCRLALNHSFAGDLRPSRGGYIGRPLRPRRQATGRVGGNNSRCALWLITLCKDPTSHAEGFLCHSTQWPWLPTLRPFPDPWRLGLSPFVPLRVRLVQDAMGLGTHSGPGILAFRYQLPVRPEPGLLTSPRPRSLSVKGPHIGIKSASHLEVKSLTPG